MTHLDNYISKAGSVLGTVPGFGDKVLTSGSLRSRGGDSHSIDKHMITNWGKGSETIVQGALKERYGKPNLYWRIYAGLSVCVCVCVCVCACISRSVMSDSF